MRAGSGIGRASTECALTTVRSEGVTDYAQAFEQDDGFSYMPGARIVCDGGTAWKEQTFRFECENCRPQRAGEAVGGSRNLDACAKSPGEIQWLAGYTLVQYLSCAPSSQGRLGSTRLRQEFKWSVCIGDLAKLNLKGFARPHFSGFFLSRPRRRCFRMGGDSARTSN